MAIASYSYIYVYTVATCIVCQAWFKLNMKFILHTHKLLCSCSKASQKPLTPSVNIHCPRGIKCFPTSMQDNGACIMSFMVYVQVLRAVPISIMDSCY